MLITFIAAGAMLGGQPVLIEPKIVSASLFKNGYAVVVREAPLDKKGETLIQTTPSSSLGTVWFTASAGTKLEEVVATQVAGTVESIFASLDEVLQGNVGKKVTLSIHEGDKVLGGSRSGTILAATGAVVVLQGEKEIVAVPKASISSMVAEGDALLWKQSVDTSTRALRVKSKGPDGGKLFVVSLERGITWAPAYSIDISDEKELKLVAKATILNDLGDMDAVETRFVTGFPNVPYAGTPDPLTSGQSMDGFINALMQAGAPSNVRFGAGAMMTQNSMRADARGGFDEAFTPSAEPGEKIEDLFFYHQPAVSLKKGDRAYYVLFTVTAPFEHIYTWDVADSAPIDSGRMPVPDGSSGLGDVWHCLKFKNTGKQPFTTGPATTFKNGELLGQDVMNYVSAGAEAQVKVTKALDIRAEQSAEEVSREKGAIKRNDGYPLFDLVTVKETLQVSNRKADKSKMRISRSLVGEVIKADGSPKVVKTTAGLNDVNVHQSIDWTVVVEGGKTVTLTFTYKVYVSAQNR
jgi:hypothetical protein